MCHFWAIFVQDKCNNKFLKFLGFFQNSPFMLKTSVSTENSWFLRWNAEFSSQNWLFDSTNDTISSEILYFPMEIIPFWRKIPRKSSWKIKRNFSNFQQFWICLDFLPRGNPLFLDFRFFLYFLLKNTSFRTFLKGVSNSLIVFRTFSDICTEFQVEIISRQEA